jgi:hypothetical protein
MKLAAFIFPPASVTDSFQDNLAGVAIKFGLWEKIGPLLLNRNFIDYLTKLDYKKYQCQNQYFFLSSRTGLLVLPRVGNTFEDRQAQYPRFCRGVNLMFYTSWVQ